MTRKDYELIAQVINETREDEGWENARSAIIWLAETLAERLEQDNPRFSSETFFKACGWEN